MKRIDTLTAEQSLMMIEVRDQWINHAFSLTKTGINKKDFEEGIEWLYSSIMKKPKPKVVYCDSWLSCLITISILKKLSKKDVDKFLGDSVGDSVWDSVGDSVRDSVRASVGDSVWDSVGDSVRASVWASVGASVWASVRASVGDSVRASVGDSVWDSVWASVRASVGDSVWASVWASVRASVGASVGASFDEYSGYFDFSNYGWLSFFDFFEKCGLDCVSEHAHFKQYKKLVKAGAFNCYEYEKIIFAIQPPVEILRDELGRLHSTNKPAVIFKDNSHYFFIHGRSCSEDIFQKCLENKISKDDFINEPNEEIKAMIYEIFGQEKIMNLLGAKEIDKGTFVHANGETEEVILYKTKEKFKELGNNPLAWVKFICPSTGTNYLIDVEPHHIDAKKAAISTSPLFISEEDYSFDART